MEMERKMFSKRHYEVIANVLVVSKIALYSELKDPRDRNVAEKVFYTIEKLLIELFAVDNHRFDVFRFKKAINVE
jgi:hypothetical protein